MALNPKIIVGGAIVAAFLFGSGKKKSSGSSSSGSGSGGSGSGGSDSNSDSDSQGDLGEPVGPNGCKTGLIEKNGICVSPNNSEGSGGKGSGGGSGSKPQPSELIIAKDCKSFQFGDKTGDSWWKNKGEKVAKQWIESGELDPLIIAFQMIKQSSVCFKTFPLKETEISGYGLYTSRFNWINNNRELWKLLWSIKNRIDIRFFGGVETVQIDPTKPAPLFGLTFGNNGKGFNLDKWWDSIGPMAAVLVQLALQAPKNNMGPIAMALGLKDPGYQDHSNTYINVPLYMMNIIFPELPISSLTKAAYNQKNPNLSIYQNPLFNEIQNRTLALDDDLLDLGEEGF